MKPGFLLIALSPLVLFACRAASSHYVPTGAASGAGPEGQSAAFYEFIPSDTRRGQVQVWVDGPQGNVFQVGFHFRNDGPTTVVFVSSMTALRYGDMDMDMKPREIAERPIAPGGDASMTLHFPYPERYHERPPKDVEVTWAVWSGAKQLRQSTTFSIEEGRSFVPRPLNSGDPLDRPTIERPMDANPVGVPIGKSPDER